MDLYIVRHAWAGHYGDPEWPDDALRPLSPEGRKRFARVVQKLAGKEFAPQVIATSPLLRCRQTAEIVAEGAPGHPQVVELDALEPGSDLEELVAWTVRQAEDYQRLAWVGHAPDVGHLTAALIGQSRAWIRFAKGGVAAVRFDNQIAPGEGELRWLATAKILGC
jgi:phosphohistidine phosphatase